MSITADRTIWLVGDGRSGTTWVCDLINHRQRYRELFEPFHPQYVDEARTLAPNKYFRAEQDDGLFTNFVSKILAANIDNPRVNPRARESQSDFAGILVKDIFANLAIFAAYRNFPGIKPILLIRNPFAVAYSKYMKRHWSWVVNPLFLLKQPMLMHDHLSQYKGLIERIHREQNYFLNLILIWAVIHYVPLRQFRSHEIHVCFYESVFRDPRTEIEAIFRYLGEQTGIDESIFTEAFSRTPSRTSGKANSLGSEGGPILEWQNRLPQALIEKGKALLSEFNLDALYTDDGLPNPDALWPQ